MEGKGDGNTRASAPVTAKDRFAGQTAKVEEVLKAQTVGLHKLDDFKKRRVEALESGSSTPLAADR